MTDLTKNNIVQEIRSNSWWIMNEMELAEYRNSEIPKNYDSNVAIFLSLSYKKEINNEWSKKIGELTDLTDLHIDETSVTDAGISELIGLTKLKTLNLRATEITNESFKTISQLKSLENLWLNEIALNGEDLKLLGNLPNLDSLFLGGRSKRANITDKDIEFLYNKESIKSLSLENTNVSSKSFDLFKSLPNLWYLVVTNTNISEAEIISFKEQNPKIIIHYIDY
jgi:hypothetical protein